MTVKMLIEKLKKINPDAIVKFNNSDGLEVLFVTTYEQDDSVVWLEDEYDVDMEEEIKKMLDKAAREDVDELDFFMELSERGIDLKILNKYLEEDQYKIIEKYYKEHGLV